MSRAKMGNSGGDVIGGVGSGGVQDKGAYPKEIKGCDWRMVCGQWEGVHVKSILN